MSVFEDVFGIVFLSVLICLLSYGTYVSWFRIDSVVERYYRQRQKWPSMTISQSTYVNIGRFGYPLAILIAVFILYRVITTLVGT